MDTGPVAKGCEACPSNRKKNGLSSSQLSPAEAVALYIELKSLRQELNDVNLWPWRLAENAHSVVSFGVFDSQNRPKAIVVGAGNAEVIMVMTCISDGDGGYSRWLAIASLIEFCQHLGVKAVLSGPQLRLTESMLHFQSVFGFKPVNLIIKTKP